jgi:hypothetical protein
MVWRAVVDEDGPTPRSWPTSGDDMVKKAIKEYPPKK